MTIEIFLAFVSASAILMLLPGPNVTFIFAMSLACGARYGLLAVAGTTSAMTIQLVLTAIGMTAFLFAMANWFEWLRWAGVIYLLYLAIQTWRSTPADLTGKETIKDPGRRIYLRGFLVSMSNPKTLVFYSAFFPQFIDVKSDFFQQFLILSVTILLLAVVIDSLWALLASRLQAVLAMSGKVRNRIAGAMIFFTALGLAFARRNA